MPIQQWKKGGVKWVCYVSSYGARIESAAVSRRWILAVKRALRGIEVLVMRVGYERGQMMGPYGEFTSSPDLGVTGDGEHRCLVTRELAGKVLFN